MTHEDELRHRAEEGDDAARDEAGMRELTDDELGDIAGGSHIRYPDPTGDGT